MFRSIRWNFLGWLALVLLLVIAGFGETLYYLVSRSKLEAVDRELEGCVRLLAEAVRRQRPPQRPDQGKGGPPGPGGSEDSRDQWREPGGKGPPRDSRSENAPGRTAGEIPPEPPPSPGSSRSGGPRFDGGMSPELDMAARAFQRFQAGSTRVLYFAMWRSDGKLLRESGSPEGLSDPPRTAIPDELNFRQQDERREAFILDPRGIMVLAGRSIDPDLAELRLMANAIIAAGGTILALACIGAWFIVTRTIRPIDAITAAAETISATNLSRRIDIRATEQELTKLAQVLNTTFERLQAAFEKQARFTADASHELRTPVAAILAQTAMARRKERTPQEYREVIDACFGAAQRMKGLVDGLLTLARADAGDLALHPAEVDLRQIVDECTDLVEPLAAERGITIRRDLENAPAHGDAEKLAQLVTNLLTNAIRYNRASGDISLALREEDSDAVLVVADSGIGIPAEALPHIFDRFFRVDASRSAQDGGLGLGLAITKAIAEAHAGTVTCASEPGKGSSFTVRLPRAPK